MACLIEELAEARSVGEVNEWKGIITEISSFQASLNHISVTRVRMNYILLISYLLNWRLLSLGNFSPIGGCRRQPLHCFDNILHVHVQKIKVEIMDIEKSVYPSMRPAKRIATVQLLLHKHFQASLLQKIIDVHVARKYTTDTT